jgi:hypothetical protein
LFSGERVKMRHRSALHIARGGGRRHE